MKHYILDNQGFITYFADEGLVCKVRLDTQTIARLLALRHDNRGDPEYLEAAFGTAAIIADMLSDGEKHSDHDYSDCKFMSISQISNEWVINSRHSKEIRLLNSFEVENDVPISVISVHDKTTNPLI